MAACGLESDSDADDPSPLRRRRRSLSSGSPGTHHEVDAMDVSGSTSLGAQVEEDWFCTQLTGVSPTVHCSTPWLNRLSGVLMCQLHACNHLYSRKGACRNLRAVEPCTRKMHLALFTGGLTCTCAHMQAAEEGSLERAQQLWSSMQQHGVKPSHATMHAFLRCECSCI